MGSLFQTPLTSFTEQRARPGFEPGTTRTQSENHTPRPTSHAGTLFNAFSSASFYTAKTSVTICRSRSDYSSSNSQSVSQNKGLVRDLNPGPLAPKARIIPLDQRDLQELYLMLFFRMISKCLTVSVPETNI